MRDPRLEVPKKKKFMISLHEMFFIGIAIIFIILFWNEHNARVRTDNKLCELGILIAGNQQGHNFDHAPIVACFSNRD
jgi:hypothetical protein